MILLDVNMLVSAHRADADQHREIKSWLEGALSNPAGVGISELALSGCLRVITHPKVFKKPTPLAQAIDFVEDFRSRDRCTFSGRARVTGKFSSISVGEATREAILCRIRSTPRWQSSLVANG